MGCVTADGRRLCSSGCLSGKMHTLLSGSSMNIIALVAENKELLNDDRVQSIRAELFC